MFDSDFKILIKSVVILSQNKINDRLVKLLKEGI